MSGNLRYRMVMDTLFMTGIQALARPLTGGRGAILMLHRVDDAPRSGFDPNAHLRVSPSFLDRLIRNLSRDYDWVSMDEAAQRLSGELPGADVARRRPFLAVTLDDAYRDNLAHAVPIFREHGVPYTIYVAPGLVEGGATLWWEDLAAAIAARDHFVLRSPRGNIDFDVSRPVLKEQVFEEMLEMLTSVVSETEQRRLVAELCWQVGVDAEAHRAASILSWAEIAELSRDPLCTIGAHTIHHYAVARLDVGEARHELVEGRRLIEFETGRAPQHFAFPYGYPAAAGPRDFNLVREAGYRTAVTTRHGVLYDSHGEHLHALPRISVNGHFQRIRYARTLLSGVPTRLSNRGRQLNVA